MARTIGSKADETKKFIVATNEEDVYYLHALLLGASQHADKSKHYLDLSEQEVERKSKLLKKSSWRKSLKVANKQQREIIHNALRFE